MWTDIPLNHLGDVTERLKGRVPWYLRTLPGVNALLDGVGSQLQELHDTIFDVFLANFLSRAKGRHLVKWGLLAGVGEPEGLDDDLYRRLIKGTMMARRCSGHKDDLIRIWQELTGPSHVEFKHLPPKGYQLTCWRDTYMSRPYAIRCAKLIRGVSPSAAVTLIEAKSHWLGFQRTNAGPVATPLGPGIPARVL